MVVSAGRAHRALTFATAAACHRAQLVRAETGAPAAATPQARATATTFAPRAWSAARACAFKSVRRGRAATLHAGATPGRASRVTRARISVMECALRVVRQANAEARPRVAARRQAALEGEAASGSAQPLHSSAQAHVFPLARPARVETGSRAAVTEPAAPQRARAPLRSTSAKPSAAAGAGLVPALRTAGPLSFTRRARPVRFLTLLWPPERRASLARS